MIPACAALRCQSSAADGPTPTPVPPPLPLLLIQIILQGRSVGPCYRDTTSVRAGVFASSCTTITASNAAVRLLSVAAKKLTLINMVLLNGRPRDVDDGGCLRVTGNLALSNVALVNCAANAVRFPPLRRRSGFARGRTAVPLWKPCVDALLLSCASRRMAAQSTRRARWRRLTPSS